MKFKTSLSVLCLSAILQATAPAEAPAFSESKVTTIPAGMPKGGVLIRDHAVKVLTSNTWTWHPFQKRDDYTISFLANGTAVNSDGWTGKWELKGLREVVIRVPKSAGPPARITFSADFTTYAGTDLGRPVPLDGKLVTPK